MTVFSLVVLGIMLYVAPMLAPALYQLASTEGMRRLAVFIGVCNLVVVVSAVLALGLGGN